MELIRNLEMRMDKSGHWQSWAVFWCDFCKQEVEKRLSHGKRNKSCGCNKNNLYKIKHGETKTRLYTIWQGIKQRILNPKAINYKYYGGRGILICPEWANDYTKFRDWALSTGCQEGLQINRINNNGNYGPNNCNWITCKEQQKNRRQNNQFTINKNQGITCLIEKISK